MKVVYFHPFIRRIVSIGMLPIGLCIAVLYSLLSIIFSIFSFLIGRPDARHIRLALILIWYLLMEFIGVLFALILWFGTGFGYAVNSTSSQRIHAKVQYFWVSSILFGAKLFLRTRLNFPEEVSFGEGPFVIAAQHSSFFDALLPTVLIGKFCNFVIPRHVLKSELLLSPSLDIYGNRLPNQFVKRNSGSSNVEVEGVRSLTKNLGSDACIIFPEGTFFTEERSRRAIQKISTTDMDRSERVGVLKNLLPVKPGGLLALLDANPESDLFLIGHNGFQPFGSFKEILKNIPFKAPIEVFIRKIPICDFPIDKAERLKFIDSEWLALDQWLETKLRDDDSTN